MLCTTEEIKNTVAVQTQINSTAKQTLFSAIRLKADQEEIPFSEHETI